MRFHIDRDQGHEIVGWLVPDNPNESPTLRVRVPGFEDRLVEATVMRSDIKELGLHYTGLVGFYVDDVVVPELSQIDDVELLEHVTGTLIYKRYKITRHLEKRLMFFDGSVFPQRKILAQIQPFFATGYELVERMSYDTLSNVFNSHHLVSNFCSGRPTYLRYAPILHDKNHAIAALLRDPYQELAERLLFLNLLGRREASASIAHFAHGFEPLMPVVANLPGMDERDLRNTMRSLSSEQRRLLANPFTRTFGCNIGEEPDFRAVSVALESLGSFDVVGTCESFADFTRLFNAALDTVVLSGEPPDSYASVEDLALRLSRITSVTQLLEYDLALYSYVEEAVERGLASV